MLGGFFVAKFLIKEGEIGMGELLVGSHLLGFMAFSNGGGIIARSIISHGQRKLSVEMVRVFRQRRFQLCDGEREITLGVIEHRIVVLFLQCRHNAFDNQPYRTDAARKQAKTQINQDFAGGCGQSGSMIKRDKLGT